MPRLITYSSLKQADWPAAIRRLEHLRVADVGPFGNASPASRWAASTYKLHTYNLGCFLGWLIARKLLSPDTILAEVATRETLVAYVEDMRLADLSSKTIAARLTAIRAVLGALSPEVEVDWLMNGIKLVYAEPSDRRNTRQRVQHTADLVELGMNLMRKGMVYPLEGPSLRHAELFRDGLIIVFMALVVPRIGTLPVMNVGEHLVRKGETYRVHWQGAEMKGGRHAHQADLPKGLGYLLGLYLDFHRPVLASRSRYPSQTSDSSPLWLHKRGKRMSQYVMYRMIISRTKAAFGVPVHPHAFRHSAGTTLLLERPDLVKILTPLLQHSTQQMRETYMLADRMEAGRRYGEMLAGRRRRARRRLGPSQRRLLNDDVQGPI